MKTNNNKIQKTAIASLMVGCLSIGTASAVAFAGSNSYETFKKAAEATSKIENMTTSTQMTLIIDGQEVMTGVTLTQIDQDARYSNSTMQVAGQSYEVENATTDGVTIRKQGEEYTSYAMSEPYRESRRQDSSPSADKLKETLSDALIGDIKNQFTSSGNTVQLNLEGAQIPEVVNLTLAAAMETRNERINDTSDFRHDDDCNLFELIPQLQSAQLQSIHYQGTIANDYLGENSFTVVLTGTDTSGTAHTIEINADTTLSDIGQTVPAAIDTTGKTVKEADLQDFGCGRRRN